MIVSSVMAIDPGETTGLCSWVPGNGFSAAQVEVDYSLQAKGLTVEQCELLTALEIARGLERMDARRGLSVLLLEDFILGRSEMDKNLLSPVRMNQSILSFTHQMEYELVMQMPSERLGISSAYLKRLGMEWATDTGELRHQTDAAKHLVTWLRRNKLIKGRRRK